MTKVEYAAALPDVLSAAKGRLATLAILGNHDYWAGADQVRQAVRVAGVTLLGDSSLRLAVDGQAVRLWLRGAVVAVDMAAAADRACPANSRCCSPTPRTTSTGLAGWDTPRSSQGITTPGKCACRGSARLWYPRATGAVLTTVIS